ncbi:MAG: glycoside hydrolase family 127 protein [Bacteroidales bacterium]|nr:glycoside hydrolase family 127 protein [Bacteroidales bacterium]
MIYKVQLFVFVSFLFSGSIWGIEPATVQRVRLDGYLGHRIDQCIANRIMAQDIDELITPFKHQDEKSRWQTEFIGKWMLGACDAYRYTQNPELLQKIKYAAGELMKTQLPNGYIGNYAPANQLAEWDVWGRKYTLLSLQAYYQLTGDKKALQACCKVADHLMTQVGPELADIATTGNFKGMAAGSILEPMVFLYNNTLDKRYLDFAKYIVRQWESPQGSMLITNALAGIPVAKRFLPIPKAVEWVKGGHKSYEMMSCYVGLLELYKITKNPSYLSAVEMTVNDIIENEINIVGGASATECWYDGSHNQTTPAFVSMETCVTFTWMQLCERLHQITGKSQYVDQIEKSTYNALQSSMNVTGSKIASYVSLEGFRRIGERQCGLNINCCESNGPRAFSMIPSIAYQTSENRIDLNLYAESKATFRLTDKNEVSVIEHTDYPVSNKVEIVVDPKMESSFVIALRIPLWSKSNSLKINNIETNEALLPGSYVSISRKWKKGDRITLTLDLRAKMVVLNNNLVIVRGPIVLARDSRFDDGFVDETIAIEHDKNNYVPLQPISEKPANMWMAFSVNALTGIYSGDKKSFRQIHVCDFGSAGSDWNEQQRYRVWLTKTIEIADRETWW